MYGFLLIRCPKLNIFSLSNLFVYTFVWKTIKLKQYCLLLTSELISHNISSVILVTSQSTSFVSPNEIQFLYQSYIFNFQMVKANPSLVINCRINPLAQHLVYYYFLFATGSFLARPFTAKWNFSSLQLNFSPPRRESRHLTEFNEVRKIFRLSREIIIFRATGIT